MHVCKLIGSLMLYMLMLSTYCSLLPLLLKQHLFLLCPAIAALSAAPAGMALDAAVVGAPSLSRIPDGVTNADKERLFQTI